VKRKYTRPLINTPNYSLKSDNIYNNICQHERCFTDRSSDQIPYSKRIPLHWPTHICRRAHNLARQAPVFSHLSLPPHRRHHVAVVVAEVVDDERAAVAVVVVAAPVVAARQQARLVPSTPDKRVCRFRVPMASRRQVNRCRVRRRRSSTAMARNNFTGNQVC
jgi:hypothetical protein